MDRNKPLMSISLIASFTAAVWCGVAGVAVAQRLIPDKPAEKAKDKKDPVLLAIRVSLGSAVPLPSPAPAPQPQARPNQPPEPPLALPLPVPDAPTLLPVLPAPAVRPLRAVTLARAPVGLPATALAKALPAQASYTGVPVYQTISYGTGAGDQPKPDYPREADEAGQEGTVILRFKVDTDGRVTDVTVAKPCAWPLLNEAAARSIRDTWSYSAGPARYFEIGIVYKRPNGD
jgi:protein TonB